MSDNNMNVSPTGALRDNKGKSPVHWVPLVILRWVAAVLWKNSIPGGGKYPESNWQKGAAYSTPLASMLRHAEARQRGEKIDPDDGLPHTWKILTNAFFLAFYEEHYPEMDDLKLHITTKTPEGAAAPAVCTHTSTIKWSNKDHSECMFCGKVL